MTDSFFSADSGRDTSKLVRLCDSLIRWTVYVLAALTPVFFLPWTVEVLELNKQLLLIAGAAVAGMAWLGKMMLTRRVEYRRSLANPFVALFLIAYALSAWFSENRYVSMTGDFGQEKAGLITALAFGILFFVITANFRDIKELRRVLMSLVVGGFVSAVYALLQGFGLFILPFSFAKTAGFNSVGTAASLAMFLSFIATLCGGLLLTDKKSKPGKKQQPSMANWFLILTAALSLVVICVVDYAPVSLSLLISSAFLVAFAFVHAKSFRGISGMLLPAIGLVLSVMLLFFRFPISLGYPSEVMPSIRASAGIAVKTLREHPFLGSGPGTFIIDYAKYRAPEINNSQFWNIRFDRSSSRVLTSLATTGLIGTLSWALVAFYLFFSAGKMLFRTEEESWHLLIGIFAAWTGLLIARVAYSSTITLEFAFWLTMAALVVAHKKDFYSVRFDQSPRAAMSVSFLFILGLVFAFSGLFVQGTRYAAEIAYAKAISADSAGGSVDDVLKKLTDASSLNSGNDLFLRNLAMASLAKAERILGDASVPEQQKNETKEAYDRRVQELRQGKLRDASQYTAAAVNTAKKATEIAPSSVANWTVLASIYQGLMGVTEGSEAWAESSYAKAIELEPANPSLYTELGKVYVFESDTAKARASDTKDDAEKAAAQKEAEEKLGKAIESFEKSASLKSDYAPASYNLALAYDRQGKLKDAIQKMEKVMLYSPQDVGVPFQLALLYYRDERKDEAIRLLEAVVERSPNFANARWYLASMYEEKGETAKALAQINEVAKTNPNDERVKQKQADLAGKQTGGDEEGLPEPVGEEDGAEAGQ